MSKTPEWAIERIKKAKDKKYKELDLSAQSIPRRKRLTEVPPEAFDLQQLEVLDLTDNLITSVPESISQLENLKFLKFRVNGLTSVPESIFLLRNLRSLDLAANSLKVIPESINKIKKLRALYLGANRLRELPQAMQELKNLRMLTLGYNLFTEIPEVVFNLTSLRQLRFDQDIGHDLGIASEEQGNISEISHKILKLKNLEILAMGGNPIERPPPEVVGGYNRRPGIEEIEKIRNYFRQLEKEGKDYLYEAKLLIVGEAGAGKTSLARKIQNMDCRLPTEDDTTRGIEVVTWEFPIPEDAPNVQELVDKEKTFRVNIWDFGGQEIYHATHQFFLTRRSLYALVADDRKEDTDFNYWLNVVELLSDKSPLLIIKNEKGDRHREINERQLRGQFANVKDTLATNLATNRGLPEVLKEIKHYVSKLPHIGTTLPKTWVKVRETLEKDARNYISVDEYLKICENNGFTELKDKLQLSGYLHDLGVCLHFQDDPLLKKTVILTPSWGTGAVYKVFDNPSVIRSLGRFNRDDLTKIWHEEKYADMRDELLQLMINFKLAYRIPGTDDYIAPELLTKNHPDYDWDESNNLIVRYTYEFMPKGIITQFIVAMHRYIADQKCVWRTGLVLTKDETKAEVVEDYSKREIRIRIAGKHKKELMTIVMYELDEIHASFHRLKYNKMIPCNCAKCIDTQEPHFYKFESLKKRFSDGRFQIECDKSYEMVNVLGLIDDVIDRKKLLHEQKKGGRIADVSIGKLFYQLLERGIDIMGESMKQEKVISIGDGASISAPVVIADTIEDSFNTLAKSDIDNNVKTLLDHLLKAVTEVTKNIPESEAAEAETMVRDTEALVKEASSSKPRRRWYEVTLNNLKETANSIGEIAKPVVDIVSKLAPLLLS